MNFLFGRQGEKMKIWIRIKVWVILVMLAFISFEILVGSRPFVDLISIYAVFAVMAALTWWTFALVKEGKLWRWLAQFSFFLDISLIVAGIYVRGGLEIPWIFGPSLITFMAAYVFGVGMGFVYAAYASFAFLGMFLLEYFKFIPHFAVYNIPGLYWIDPGYFIDAVIGIFMMNFAMAFAIGSLSKLTDQRDEKIEEYLRELEQTYERSSTLLSDVEDVRRLAEDKRVEVDRNIKIIDDRESEIAETEKEIERIRGEKDK